MVALVAFDGSLTEKPASGHENDSHSGGIETPLEGWGEDEADEDGVGVGGGGFCSSDPAQAVTVTSAADVSSALTSRLRMPA